MVLFIMGQRLHNHHLYSLPQEQGQDHSWVLTVPRTYELTSFLLYWTTGIQSAFSVDVYLYYLNLSSVAYFATFGSHFFCNSLQEKKRRITGIYRSTHSSKHVK